MPLKLIPPRPGKTPFYSVRGTHLDRYVDRSTRLADKATARRLLHKWEAEIERGVFREKAEATFGDAALSYIQAGHGTRFIKRIVDYYGPHLALADVNQSAIDRAAREIYPGASAATRNRQVYTPVSAILKHAGVNIAISRPKGSQGTQRTRWLWPEDVEKLLSSAACVDREFAALLTTLLYTGMRLSEGLSLTIDNLRIDEGFVYLPDSKNGEPRAIHLMRWLRKSGQVG